MPSTRISRGLVSLAASAITAVYVAGYLHTQAADSTYGDSGVTAPVAVETVSPMSGVPSLTPAPRPAVLVATATPAPAVITDEAVEMYADKHHIGWDEARAQMKAAGGIEQQAPTAIARARPTATLSCVRRQLRPRQSRRSP